MTRPADGRGSLIPGTGLYVDYDYLVTGDVSAIRENGAGSGVGVLATYGYDDLGRRSLTRGNGTVTSYGYDPVSRLGQLAQNLLVSASGGIALVYDPMMRLSDRRRHGRNDQAGL